MNESTEFLEEVARRVRIALAEAGYPDPGLVLVDTRNDESGVLVADSVPDEIRLRALSLADPDHEWTQIESGIIPEKVHAQHTPPS